MTCFSCASTKIAENIYSRQQLLFKYKPLIKGYIFKYVTKHNWVTSWVTSHSLILWFFLTCFVLLINKVWDCYRNRISGANLPSSGNHTTVHLPEILVNNFKVILILTQDFRVRANFKVRYLHIHVYIFLCLSTYICSC